MFEREQKNRQKHNSRPVFENRRKKTWCKSPERNPKAKKWGESLRRDFINNARNAAAIEILICSSSLENAKFWIENRNNTNLELDLAEIMTITEALNSGKDADAARRIELIEKLGI